MHNTQPDAEFLLVDDDPNISEFLATYLSRRGHPSDATMEAEKALDWLSEKRDWPVSRQLWWGHRIPVWTCRLGRYAGQIDDISKEKKEV